VDWNNDGRKDLIVGDSGGRVWWYQNVTTDADPRFTNGVIVWTTPGGDKYANPEVVDWNNDGRKDLVCGATSGNVYLLLNANTDAAPLFAGAIPIQDGPTNLVVSGASSPVVADWDRDGKKDLLVGEFYKNIRFYRNQNTDASPAFNGWTGLATEDGRTIQLSSNSKPEVMDLDKDGLGDLVAGDGGGMLTFYHAINPARPWFKLAGVLFNDRSGNGDSILSAGETGHLMVCLSNTMATASNVIGVLRTTSTNLTVTQPAAEFGILASNGWARNSTQPYCVQATAAALPLNACNNLLLDIYHGRETDPCQTLSLQNRYKINPNALFQWEDIGEGTPVQPVTDLDLGFAFPFFGEVFTNARVSSYGPLLHPLPQDMPWGRIMPLGDNFEAGFTVTNAQARYALLGAAPNRRWVAQWNEVSYSSIASHLPHDSTNTFQVILYEHGAIKFQYGACAGPASDGRRATIGLTAAGGLDAAVYSARQPGAVTNGRAILFTLNGEGDADADGLTDDFEYFYFGNLSAAPDQDADGDGMTNADEWRCATDPTLSRSVLEMEGIEGITTNEFVIQWQSIPCQLYDVQQAVDLAAGGWTNINPAPIPGTPAGFNTYTTAVDTAASRGFFRVAVH
jgi:hypothetical protein